MAEKEQRPISLIPTTYIQSRKCSSPPKSLAGFFFYTTPAVIPSYDAVEFVIPRHDAGFWSFRT